MHMDKDKTTHGNQEKGRIKGSSKIDNLSQEEVPLRKYLTAYVNLLCFRRRYMNFNNSKSNVTNKG